MPRKRSSRVSSRKKKDHAERQDEVCHFWKLPLELRNMVYGFAYGSDRTITPIAKKHLDCSKTSPFKTVDEVRLVSKQFHAEAMQHLVEHNTFRLEQRNNTLVGLPLDFAANIRRLLLDLSCWTYPYKLDLNYLCPRLRSLKIWSLPLFCQFHDLPNSLQTEAGIRGCRVAKHLALVRGLKDFRLVRPTEVMESRRIRSWFRNDTFGDTIDIGLAEEVLRSIVTREKIERRSRTSRVVKKTIDYCGGL